MRALASALKRVWPAAALAAVLLLAGACRGEDAGDAGAALPPIASATTASGSDGELDPVNPTGSFLLPFYKSVYDLVRVDSTILVGRVTGYLLQCDHRRGFLGEPTPDYSDCDLHPEQKKCLVPSPSPEELSRPSGHSFSVFSVEVQQVIASESLRPGDTIGVMQSGAPGGICVDTPPEVAAAYDPQAAYENDYETRIEIGSTYLFFLQPRPGLTDIGVSQPWGTTYSGPPYGRFLIGADGRLQIVAKAWTCSECAAPKALAGKTVAEAETTLRPVMEQTRPTPTPTPQVGTPSPTPTATPTPTPTSTPTPQQGTPTPTPQPSTP